MKIIIIILSEESKQKSQNRKRKYKRQKHRYRRALRLHRPDDSRVVRWSIRQRDQIVCQWCLLSRSRCMCICGQKVIFLSFEIIHNWLTRRTMCLSGNSRYWTARSTHSGWKTWTQCSTTARYCVYRMANASTWRPAYELCSKLTP